MKRREFVAAAAALSVSHSLTAQQEKPEMYGLIRSLTANAGKRDAVIDILIRSITQAPMPGCLSYIVAKDAADENTIWMTQVWDSKASWEGATKAPAARQMLGAAMPMVAKFGSDIVTMPVGGQGLSLKKAP